MYIFFFLHFSRNGVDFSIIGDDGRNSTGVSRAELAGDSSAGFVR